MDKLEKKLLYILKTTGLIILLLIFQIIPVLLFNIDLNKLSLLQKILYLLITDIILIIIYINYMSSI